MLRGIEIEPDHIGGLLLELGVVGRHVALHPVWLDPVLLPGPSHHHVVDAELLGQAPRTPVRRPVARLLARPVQDPSLHLGCQHRHGPSLVPDVEPGQPLRNEPFLPLADERLRAIDPTRDLPVGHPLGQQEQDTGDPSIIGSPCPTPRTPLKLGSFLLRQSDRIGSHAIQSNTKLLSVTAH